MHEETRHNLHSVMRDQAYAHAVFWLSAQHCRSDVAVAVLFERAARARLEDNFAGLAPLADPTPRIADLLADAIRLDAEQDYREFIAQARDLGDTEVAEALSAIQSFRDAELEALQAARMRHQLTTPPPTEAAPRIEQEEPARTVDLPPVAAIATTPIPEPSPVEPEQPMPSDEPADPTAGEHSLRESEAERPSVDADQDVEDSAERVVEVSEEPMVVTLRTPAGVIEDDEPSRLEEPAVREGADEYHVIYIDKHTKKTEEGARELETRLSLLAQDGWSLTATIGSQLILHRAR